MGLNYFWLIALLLFFGCAKPKASFSHKLTCNNQQSYYSLLSSECLSENDFIDSITPYRVIFIGDEHGEKDLHVKIASLLESLHKRGYNVHVANEWFRVRDNATLKAFKAGDINTTVLQNDTNFSKRIGYDFDSYGKIYATDVSLYGINMDKSMQKAISSDAISMKNYIAHLDMNVSVHQEIVEPFMHHCKVSSDESTCKKRMYRVQVAWDSYMASSSNELAKKVLTTSKDKLIIFAGSMHLAYHSGINLRFARLNHTPQITLLPIEQGSKKIDVGYSDFVLFYKASDDVSNR